MIKLILLSFLVTFSMSQTLHAKIYKWTDSEGKVHYSATPPRDTKTKAENIEDKIKFNIGKVQPSSRPKAKARKSAEGNRATKTTKADYENDKTQARMSYCNGLKRNINTLETSKNVNIAEEGNLKPLSDSEKAARLAKEKSKHAKNCAGM